MQRDTEHAGETAERRLCSCRPRERRCRLKGMIRAATRHETGGYINSIPVSLIQVTGRTTPVGCPLQNFYQAQASYKKRVSRWIPSLSIKEAWMPSGIPLLVSAVGAGEVLFWPGSAALMLLPCVGGGLSFLARRLLVFAGTGLRGLGSHSRRVVLFPLGALRPIESSAGSAASCRLPLPFPIPSVTGA